jgi:hypothetical protein
VKGGWAKVRRFEDIQLNRLKKHSYKSEIEEVIIRYVRALDHSDLHVAFLLLWGVLETLTHTINADYERMVRRVAFHYRDAELQKQILQHLRTFRNESVHSGYRKTQIEGVLYQLKECVDDLIIFHLANHFRFQSFEEAAAFSDLNPDLSSLKTGLKKYRNALRYRTPRT